MDKAQMLWDIEIQRERNQENGVRYEKFTPDAPMTMHQGCITRKTGRVHADL